MVKTIVVSGCVNVFPDQLQSTLLKEGLVISLHLHKHAQLFIQPLFCNTETMFTFN